MTQLVSITQAARNALAVWLAAELSAVSGLVVEPRWFEVDRQHPAKSITVIDAGPRKIEWTDPVALTSADVVDPALVEVTWGLGYIDQRVQLDVWAPSDVELDDLMARLEAPLNAGTRALGVGTNHDPFGIGVLLALADGWAPGTVDFTFDEPNADQTADAANQAEWRASYRGVARLQLVAKATSPKLARIIVRQRISEAPVDTDATVDLITTVDADTAPDI